MTKSIMILLMMVMSVAVYSATLRIEVVPADAEIYLPTAGLHSWGSKTFDYVTAGTHTIRVFCPGYVTYEEKMDLLPGEKYERKVGLKKLSNVASPTVVEREFINLNGEKTKSYNGLIEPRYKVMYTYPEAARKHKIHGTVIVEAFIGEWGEVIDTRVIQSVQPCHGGLDEVAVNYIKQWKYSRDEGTKPVATSFTIPVKFTLPNLRNFKVKVIPHDAEVMISTNTHPVGALFQDIKYIGGLAEGPHILRVFKEGYEQYEEPINLDWSKKFKRVIRLKKLNDNVSQPENSKP
jgi:TonB family protein